MKFFICFLSVFLFTGCALFQSPPSVDSADVDAACMLLCIPTRDVDVNAKQMKAREDWKRVVSPELCQQLCESAYEFITEELAQ